MRFTLLPLLPVVASALLFPPTARLANSGATVALLGSGPPVVFSSGLFGTMPRLIYSDLLRKMSENVTLVVPKSPTALDAAYVEDVATTLGVDSVGLFSHSSIGLETLRLPYIRSAVLCDPVVMPSVRVQPFQFPVETTVSAPTLDTTYPVLVLRAQNTYNGSNTPLPLFLEPVFTEGVMRDMTFEHVGHADLLDDAWAELGPRVIPWMTPTRPAPVPFADWSMRRSAGALRKAYRTAVAQEACAHLLAEPAALTQQLVR